MTLTRRQTGCSASGCSLGGHDRLQGGRHAGYVKEYMSETVTPTCRYGHGPLARMDLRSHDDKPRGIMFSTFQPESPNGRALFDGNGYSVIGYRCKVCRYMEFFDEGDE